MRRFAACWSGTSTGHIAFGVRFLKDVCDLAAEAAAS
jgi:hypothetical protein